MAYTTSNDLPDRLRLQADHLFARIGQGFNAYLERRARTDQIARLEALGDAELARRGIKREIIVYHVFRDKLGL
ncbi:MAG: hypothetical protein ACK4LQ_10455 [Pararhodobacter sp.]